MGEWALSEEVFLFSSPKNVRGGEMNELWYYQYRILVLGGFSDEYAFRTGDKSDGGKLQKRPRCWKAERVLYYGVNVGERIHYQCWRAVPLRELSRNAMLGGMVGEVLLPLFQSSSKPGSDPSHVGSSLSPWCFEIAFRPRFDIISGVSNPERWCLPLVPRSSYYLPDRKN